MIHRDLMNKMGKNEYEMSAHLDIVSVFKAVTDRGEKYITILEIHVTFKIFQTRSNRVLNPGLFCS